MLKEEEIEAAAAASLALLHEVAEAAEVDQLTVRKWNHNMT